jgi:biopolymer transport protein TolR
VTGKWFDHDAPVMSDINVTPLVDVSLVLLVVFMITAPMMVQGANVQLPRTVRMDSLPQDRITVTITDEGQMQLNGEAIPPEELETRLSPLVAPGSTVLVYGDQDAQYGMVMRVMAIAHSLGADIGLPTEPIPGR